MNDRKIHSVKQEENRRINKIRYVCDNIRNIEIRIPYFLSYCSPIYEINSFKKILCLSYFEVYIHNIPY